MAINTLDFRMNGITYGWSSAKAHFSTLGDEAPQSEGLMFLSAMLTGVDYVSGHVSNEAYAAGSVPFAAGIGNYSCSGTLTFRAEAEAALMEIGKAYGGIEFIPPFTLNLELSNPALNNLPDDAVFPEGAALTQGALVKVFPNVKLGQMSSGLSQGDAETQLSIPFFCTSNYGAVNSRSGQTEGMMSIKLGLLKVQAVA